MRLYNLKYSLYILSVSFRRSWKAFIVLIVGLLITLVATVYTGKIEVRGKKKDFSLVCDEIRTKIEIRLQSYSFLLRGGSAYAASSDTVSRKEWHAFLERIKINKNLDGVQGVGYAIMISPNQLQQHIKHIREEGFPTYTVNPAGAREIYTSIIYIEPLTDRNLRALGYDMFSEGVRRKAMEQSRDSDQAVLSGKVTLVQETGKDVQAGSLMYVPVYRDKMALTTVAQRRIALKGWVYIPFRMNDLMNGILGQWDFDKLGRIQLQVYDEKLSDNSLIYNSRTVNNQSLVFSPGRTISLPIDFNGKQWILHLTQSRELYYLSSKVIIVFLSGITISFLLMALSLALFRTLEKAQQIAEQSTRELKESEDRFKILLNSTAEAIYGLDLDGNCTFSNKSCIQMLGLDTPDQLLGKNMHELIHHSHADGGRYDVNECRIHSAFTEGLGSHVDDEVLWRPDGTCFPSEYWSYPLYINGVIEGAVVTFLDITERKQSIEKINNARSEAEKANLAKSEFLSRMSHELRTPMNSILGFSQLLEMGDKLNTQQRRSIGYILSSGKHLLNLINEVLEISRIEAGHIELLMEPVNINNLIREILGSVQPLAMVRQIKLELKSQSNNQFFVNSDRQRLKQVLLNLLSNAVKYNIEGGSVIIETKKMTANEEGIVPVRISIIDTGSGISPEDLHKLYRPFERIGAENSTTEGTGLGLAVVKKLIDAMNGTTGVESARGQGSTFWIELPESKDLSKNLVNTGIIKVLDLTADLKKGTILYIEDNVSNIELVEQVISSHRLNIRLITNTNGRQTVPLSLKFKPDLILLDLNLPDIQGDEVITLLQSEEYTKKIPVVVISADAMPHQRERLLKAGARGYLTKPLDVPGFLLEVDKWVG